MTKNFRLATHARLVLLFGVLTSGAAASDSVSLEARVCMRANETSLSFELTNSAADAVVVRKDSLPWHWWYGAAVKVRDAETGEPLEALLPVEDPPPPSGVTIDPQQTLFGQINLEVYFPTLRSEGRNKRVEVDWRVDLRSLDGQVIRRLEGSLVMPVGFLDGDKILCQSDPPH